jgi:hypothetical protein
LKTAVIAAFALGGWTLGGCGEVEEHIDCFQICDRYEECWDEGYDVSACTDECETNADTEDGYEEKASACEDCLDGRSCAGSFPCADECIGIVP